MREILRFVLFYFIFNVVIASSSLLFVLANELWPEIGVGYTNFFGGTIQNFNNFSSQLLFVPVYSLIPIVLMYWLEYVEEEC